jgi:tetratricopeptide (TPR) repeat protein
VLVDRDGCLALGTLAARDEEIFGRVSAMYLRYDRAEALRGAETLAFALDYLPERVCNLVRTTWERERARTAPAGESAGRRLSDTLLPLYRVTHREAAIAVRRTLDELTGSLDLTSLPDGDRLLDVIDFIRGGLIPYEGGDALAALLRELESPELQTRLRAAAVLRSVGQEVPEQVAQPLCEAIRREQAPEVLARLLRSTYRVLELAAANLLRAVEANAAVIWSQPASAAAALSLLGHAARYSPETVLRLLPRRFEQFEPWARACLADVLAFAWWRCAEHQSEGRAVLEALREPDLTGMAQSFRVFAERGAAVARLGRLCLGSVDAQSTMVSMTREVPGVLPYYYTNTRHLFLRHAERIAGHAEVQALAESLRRVVRAGHGLPPMPWHEPLQSAQHIAARNALDELVEIALRQADPLASIQDLPRDWEALYAARRLLQAGLRGENLIAFASAACAEPAQGGSLTALGERDICLGEIALASGNPGGAVAARFEDRTPSLFGSAAPGSTHGVVAYVDDHPEQIFTHLETAVRDIEAVVALFHWRGLARRWRSLLVAEVFGRMFDRRPIEHGEAVQLVRQMREVISTLPPSPTRDEYDRVYGAIASWLSGTPVSLTLPALPETAVRSSHVLAARLLTRAQTAVGEGEGPGWIEDFLWDRRSWWESHRYEIRDGTISAGLGEGLYLIYMFPALRLALVAVGHHLGRPDPAGQFMAARCEALERAVAARRRADATQDPAQREHILGELEGPDPSAIRDERVLGAAGLILLFLGRPPEAEARLRRALASPLLDRLQRADALYNLACVLARSGREEECRTSLEEAVSLVPRQRAQLLQDEDFAAVRDRDWFQALAAPPPAPADAPEPAPELPPALRFESPLVSVEPGQLPSSFEGWEFRYSIREEYNRHFPVWARAIRAALSLQFPGATVLVEPVPELTGSLAITSPEGVAHEQATSVRTVADQVTAEVGRRAVGEA